MYLNKVHGEPPLKMSFIPNIHPILYTITFVSIILPYDSYTKVICPHLHSPYQIYMISNPIYMYILISKLHDYSYYYIKFIYKFMLLKNIITCIDHYIYPLALCYFILYSIACLSLHSFIFSHTNYLIVY